MMPAYSIQHDPPWIKEPPSGASYAPTESIYSEDYEGAPYYNRPDMPSIPPLRIKRPSDHAHPQQDIRDKGPQLRQSRMPIFKQVRSMLQRPSRLDTNGGTVKYDEFSGDFSETGRAPDLRPSTYKPTTSQSPFDARQSLPRRVQKQPKSVRSLSPVSILHDEDTQHYSPQLGWDGDQPPSPVSPVSEVSHEDDVTPSGPSEVAVNARAIPRIPSHSQMNAIKRKPAPNRRSASPENIPPHTSHSHGIDFASLDDAQQQKSRFSWTTVAPSLAPTRPSTDTRASPQMSENGFPQSRFSWSTVNTAATNQMRPESPPPSPLPALPPQYRTPPVQSILSRHRPVQRSEKEIWNPPIRKTSLPVSRAETPSSARSKLSIESPRISTGSEKKLPPPPQLLTPVSPMSRLETLLAEEQDKQQQRRNLEKAIAEHNKTEMASPMDVSFAQLREAKKKLGELRTTLAEVQLEEREIGIAISRARRKEGEEEGLWIRRVTK